MIAMSNGDPVERSFQEAQPGDREFRWNCPVREAYNTYYALMVCHVMVEGA